MPRFKVTVRETTIEKTVVVMETTAEVEADSRDDIDADHPDLESLSGWKEVSSTTDDGEVVNKEIIKIRRLKN